ncbi:hypothetical protein [Tsukamurella spumae]|nr:hypothetical protein [Tsukamurella spumae]
MGRQLAVVERTDLSFYKGWEGCYVEWVPSNYLETMRTIRTDYSTMSEEDAERAVLDLIKERVVGGKVKVLAKGGSVELVGLESSDLEAMPTSMIDRIYADMTGVKYDADPLGETTQDEPSSTDTDLTSPPQPTTTTETQ